MIEYRLYNNFIFALLSHVRLFAIHIVQADRRCNGRQLCLLGVRLPVFKTVGRSGSAHTTRRRGHYACCRARWWRCRCGRDGWHDILDCASGGCACVEAWRAGQHAVVDRSPNACSRGHSAHELPLDWLCSGCGVCRCTEYPTTCSYIGGSSNSSSTSSSTIDRHDACAARARCRRSCAHHHTNCGKYEQRRRSSLSSRSSRSGPDSDLRELARPFSQRCTHRRTDRTLHALRVLRRGLEPGKRRTVDVIRYIYYFYCTQFIRPPTCESQRGFSHSHTKSTFPSQSHSHTFPLSALHSAHNSCTHSSSSTPTQCQ